MLIERTSIFTGRPNQMDLPVTMAQVAAWQGGVLIQNAMPQLDASQREFLLTGATPEEWARHMPTEEEEEHAPGDDELWAAAFDAAAAASPGRIVNGVRVYPLPSANSEDWN